MFVSLLPATVLLSVAVSAIPQLTVRDSPITLPLSRRFNNITTPRQLVEHDLRRARALLKSPGRRDPSTPAINHVVSYIAGVGVGSPPTQYDLIIDTGSSNTWVGAAKPYVKTSTSMETSNAVDVNYGSGDVSGREYTDLVTLGSGLSVRGQSVGVATTSSGFHDVDGILGIGPDSLTKGTLFPAINATIPTVTDNLFSQGSIHLNLISISFAPTSTTNDTNGQLTWGGIDHSKVTGNITYVPVTSTFPASEYWGIDQTITYGPGFEILPFASGIVDTGTTLLLIATDAFQRYRQVTGADFDRETGLLRISFANYANLKSLFFKIGGTTFEYTANAQTWPRSLNTLIGGDPNAIYLVVADVGDVTDSGGLDFVNGQVWLERFYSVYDTSQRRVGIANTPFTNSTMN